MAVPTYTTDLLPVNLIEAGTSFTEFTGYTLGGPPVNDTDYFIQGSGCGTSPLSNKTGLVASIGIDYGSDLSGSFSAGDCVFMWQVMLAGNAMETLANGGLRLLIGTDFANYYGYYTGGKDFGRNPYGGWQNVVVDPTFTPVDYTGGTGNGGAYQTFGSALNMVTGIGKGNLHGMDAIRYGRGELIVEYGSVGDGYATFAGMTSTNDNISNRWGLFQEVGGGYLYKGLISIGTSSNAVDFNDSNRVITVDITPRAYLSFNKIEINNSSSVVVWDGILITSLDGSSLSPGQFEVIDNATVTFDDCVFTDLDTMKFLSNSTINTTTFRRCNQVDQGGGVFDGCIFDESPAAVSLYATDIDNIDNCDFNSDGSNHGIELSTDHAGNSYTLSGCTFTGYAASDGSTGNECIYNDSSGAVTISVGAGQLPSIRNGLGASTTVSASVPIYIIVSDTNGDPIQNVQTAIYKTSDRTELVNQDTDVNGEVDTSYTDTTPISVEVRCRKASSGSTKYKNYSSLQTIATTTGLSLSITLVEDPNNNAIT